MVVHKVKLFSLLITDVSLCFLVELFRIVDEVIMRLVMVIMYISPIGIASIIAAKILGRSKIC